MANQCNPERPAPSDLFVRLLQVQFERDAWKALAGQLAEQLANGTETMKAGAQALDRQREAIEGLLALRRTATEPSDN